MRRSYPNCPDCRRLGANAEVAANVLAQQARMQAHARSPQHYTGRVARAKSELHTAREIYQTHQAECLIAHTTE